MRNAPKTRTPLTLVALLLLVLAGCAKPDTLSSSVGVLMNKSADGQALNSVVASEQNDGYKAGFSAASVGFEQKTIDESVPQSDIQRTIRSLAEDEKAPLVAVLGATSNNASSHAAALVNFFNIPMLVPSANGDNLFPSNNMWAFRLSAPGAAYANYLFGNLITKQAIDKIITDLGSPLGVAAEFKIAILYEENTFGESAAVAAATAAMAQTINIKVYSKFKAENPDPASLKTLATNVKDAEVQLVYIVSSDPAVAKNLVQTFRGVFDAQSMPILVGQAGGFATQDFLGSKEAQGVYVLRQNIERANCPVAIQTSYDAQSYAAVYLLDQVVQQARSNLAGAAKQFSITGQGGPTIQQQREAIRDVLKQINMDVPCLGSVAFDNAGQNKLLKLDLIVAKTGEPAGVKSSGTDFLAVLKNLLANELQP